MKLPLSVPLLCPLRIMFMASYPLSVRRAALVYRVRENLVVKAETLHCQWF